MPPCVKNCPKLLICESTGSEIEPFRSNTNSSGGRAQQTWLTISLSTIPHGTTNKCGIDTCTKPSLSSTTIVCEGVLLPLRSRPIVHTIPVHVIRDLSYRRAPTSIDICRHHQCSVLSTGLPLLVAHNINKLIHYTSLCIKY